MKTIAHIGFSGLGGVSDLICTLGGNDARNRHHFLLSGIEPPGEELLARLEKAGMTAHIFVKQQGLDLQQARSIGQCLKELKPDLIIAHGLVHLNFCFFHRPSCPLVMVEHQNFYLQPRSYYLRGLLFRSFVSAYLFTTEESRRLALARYGGVFRGKRSYLIPNPIDPVYFEEIPGLQEEPGSLIMCGRLMASKDHGTVIRALHRLRGEHKLHFYITGHGETRPALEALVGELGLGDQVTFCGILPLSDLIERQRNTAIYVQSSEGETLSIAVLNALALKKIVVGSDVSGINNLLRHGENGFLFEHGNVEALCAVLRQAMADPHNALREQARADALRYHPSTIVGEYQAMFDQLCPSR